MRKFIPGRLVVILSGLVMAFFSCAPQTCFDETESFLKASFYIYNNTTKVLQAPDSITLYGLNMETNKIYNNALKVQPALIPLNSSADSCVLIIRINGITDTLTFRYNSFPHLISKECGYTYYHTLDTNRIYTKHGISDMKFSNRNITTLNGTNIEIYY